MNLERELSAIELRVIGCLIEKEATTPDQYPLTLNALRVAANQKTNRFPIASYHAGEIEHTARVLADIGLVREVHGARVARYEHCFGKKMELHLADVAVLCVLMLRGPQTISEIRSHCHRIHNFDDNDDVAYVLNRLNEQDAVLKLPRGAGQKEDRYCQLLSGQPDLESIQTIADTKAQTRTNMEQRIEQLEEQVAQLQIAIESLR